MAYDTGSWDIKESPNPIYFTFSYQDERKDALAADEKSYNEFSNQSSIGRSISKFDYPPPITWKEWPSKEKGLKSVYDNKAFEEKNVYDNKVFEEKHVAVIPTQQDLSSANVSSDNEISSEKKHETLTEFSDRVTLHGFRYLVVESGWKWLAWLLITSCSFVICIALSYSMFEDFINRRHFPETSINYVATEATYPTITMCPNQRLKPPKFTEADMNSLETNCSLDDSTELCQEYLTERERMDDVWREWDAPFIVEDMFTDELESFTKNKSCYAEEKACSNVTKLFKPVTVWPNKQCFQYNSHITNPDGIVVKHRGMFKNGLFVYMDLYFIEENDLHGPYSGVELYVHSHGNEVLASEYSSATFLTTGELNIISLTPKMEVFLPPPYSTECGEKPIKYLKRVDKPYSKADCVADCHIAEVFEKCQCINKDIEEHVVEVLNICQTHDEKKCYLDFFVKEQYNRTKCEFECPLECERPSFDIKLSQASISNYGALFRTSEKNCERLYQFENKTEESHPLELALCRLELMLDFGSNFISVWVGFDSFKSYTVTATPATTISSLLGTMGGSIGLCMGFSVITLFEFIMFIYDVIRAKVTSRAGRKKSTNVQT